VNVEIDITWACNLRCNNCNRSCEQAPTGEGMTLGQIQHFVDESIGAGQQWRRIRLLGGEPTLHPQFLEMVDVLRAWRDAHAPGCQIEVASNGYGDKVRGMLARIPADVHVDNTQKSTVEQPFLSFNIAPVDQRRYRHADYRNACWVSENCGVGLTASGWYPCAIAGGIDRIVGHDMGRQTLPAPTDDLHDQLETFCRGCGGFKRQAQTPVTQPVMSRFWNRAYGTWKERPPMLTRYGARSKNEAG
jgi:hypothetical protein